MNDFIAVNVTHVYLDTSEIESRLTVANQRLAGIQAAMADTQSRLGDLVQRLDNPDAVAAEEKVRKGWTALANGWHDDAVEELDSSLARYKYRALPHLLVGIARMESDVDRAISHFQDAVKYGAAADAAAAVSAALIAAELLDRLGRGREAESVLRGALVLGESPELLLALAARGAADAQERSTLRALLETGRLPAAARPLTLLLLADEIPQREGELRDDLRALLDAMSSTVEVMRSAVADPYPPITRLTSDLRAGKDLAIAVEWLDASHTVFDTLDQTLRSTLRRFCSLVGSAHVVEVDGLDEARLDSLVAVGQRLRSRGLTLAGVAKDAAALASTLGEQVALAAATVMPPSPTHVQEPALHDYVQRCRHRAAEVAARSQSLLSALALVPERHAQLTRSIERITRPGTSDPVLRPMLNLPVPIPAELAVPDARDDGGISSPEIRNVASLDVVPIAVPFDFVELATPQAAARAAARPALTTLLHTIVQHLDRLGRPTARQLGPYRSGVFGGKPRPTGPWAYETYSYKNDQNSNYPETRTVCVTVEGSVVVEVRGRSGTTVHQGFDEDRRTDPEYLQRIVLPLYTALVNRGVVLSVDPTILALDHWHAAFFGGGAPGFEKRQTGVYRPLYPYPLE